ncbi:MAG TPA: hypothetical protein VGZ22_17155, partial [Isosphaeraceae bacterium]|nr:hypothetical protein [Isosphaeraceae bacterium]
MDELRVNLLAERVGQLESENRRWRRGGLLALVGAAVVMIGGSNNAQIPKEVSAERLSVRDKNGKERIIMVVNGNDAPVMGFLDATGKELMDFNLDPSGIPIMSMRDINNVIRMVLKVGANGVPELALIDKDGKSRLILVSRTDGAPVVGLFDKDEKE